MWVRFFSLESNLKCGTQACLVDLVVTVAGVGVVVLLKATLAPDPGLRWKDLMSYCTRLLLEVTGELVGGGGVGMEILMFAVSPSPPSPAMLSSKP